MRLWPVSTLLAFAAIAAPLAAQVPGDAIDSIFSTRMSAASPGCAVSIARRGHPSVTRSYGMAHIGLGVPMTSSTVMWIPYSEGRVFTALAVAMLARDGQVSLADRIRRYFPELPEYADAVTVGQLLHHGSGLPDYGALAGPSWQLSDRLSEATFFRLLRGRHRLEFTAGEGFGYSNTDYALLRLLVARVTSKGLGEFLDERLFRPLGMHATSVGRAPTASVAQRAPFYEGIGEAASVLMGYRTSPVGGIAVTTSVDDLARWDEALRTKRLGLDSLLAGLEASAPAAARSTGEFSFGRYIGELAGMRAEFYRGVGEYVFLVRLPDAGLSVATLCNSYEGMWEFGARIAAHYLPAAPAVRAAPASPLVMPPPSRIDATELRRYVGVYREEASVEPFLTVQLLGDSLAVTAPNGQRFSLTPHGTGRFSVNIPGGAKILLTFADSGTAGGMHLSQRLVPDGAKAGPDLVRGTSWRPSTDMMHAVSGRYIGELIDDVVRVDTSGNSLVAWSRGFDPSPLVPVDEGVFFLLGYRWRFLPDTAKPGAMRLVLDHPRAKGIEYMRDQR